MVTYKIGEVARLLGLTTQALRFYEQEGVLTPCKSENGTRYYTTDHIIRLLSFKKYRLSDFSVQDVVSHFKADSLDSLSSRLDEHSDALIAQSEQLLRRAKALRAFGESVRACTGQLEIPVVCRPEPIYALAFPLDTLTSADKDRLAAMDAFVDAMPAAFILFCRDSQLSGPPRFHLAASIEDAEAWNLPLDRARRETFGLYARLHLRCTPPPWFDSPMEKALSCVRAAGYRIDSSRDIWGRHWASETVDNQVFLLGTLYVPILSP